MIIIDSPISKLPLSNPTNTSETPTLMVVWSLSNGQLSWTTSTKWPVCLTTRVNSTPSGLTCAPSGRFTITSWENLVLAGTPSRTVRTLSVQSLMHLRPSIRELHNFGKRPCPCTRSWHIAMGFMQQLGIIHLLKSQIVLFQQSLMLLFLLPTMMIWTRRLMKLSVMLLTVRIQTVEDVCHSFFVTILFVGMDWTKKATIRFRGRDHLNKEA